jgi:hypothetical protein
MMLLGTVEGYVQCCRVLWWVTVLIRLLMPPVIRPHDEASPQAQRLGERWEPRRGREKDVVTTGQHRLAEVAHDWLSLGV